MLDKAYRALIWTGLTFLLIWSPLAFGAVPKRIWSITPVLLVVCFLVFIWLWKMNNAFENRDSPLRGQSLFSKSLFFQTALDKPILAFAVLAVVSFVFSIYKYDSFYALLRLFAYVGIYYLIVNNYSRSLRRYLISLVICIGTGLSIYGLLQYFGVLPHTWWNPKDFLAATYVNHNHFSGYLELVIPVTIGAVVGRLLRKNGTVPCGDSPYFPRNGKILIGVLVIALAVMLAAFVFAQSRGAWISLGISLLVMNIILIKRKVLKKESLFIFVLLVVLAFAFLYANGGLVSKRIETIKKVTTGEASMDTRLAIWQGTTDMIYHNPWIGVGIGDYKWGFPRYRPVELATIDAHYAHNDYLHMMGEMGLFALPIMLLMLVRVIGRGLFGKNGTVPCGDSPYFPIVLGCAIGCLSLALHGLVDFNFHIPANMILFTIYAAIIMREDL